MHELTGTNVSLGGKENYPCHTWIPSLQLPAPPPSSHVSSHVVLQSQSITAWGGGRNALLSDTLCGTEDDAQFSPPTSTPRGCGTAGSCWMMAPVPQLPSVPISPAGFATHCNSSHRFSYTAQSIGSRLLQETSAEEVWEGKFDNEQILPKTIKIKNSSILKG